MLGIEKQKELREILERSQKPVFFFDNDADGLCSYVLLRRWLGRGKGVAVRSYPDLDEGYARKVEEFGADAVFVLDKPVLSKSFVKAISDLNLPLVLIDHHKVQGEDFSEFSNFSSYNNLDGDGVGEPVTYLAYKLSGKKEDSWIAMMGCVADHYLPDFASDFSEEYPEFWASGIKKPFDAYYGSEIGKIARALNFGLKDSITNVVAMQNHLINCQGPGDVLAEVVGNKALREKYGDVKKKYDLLLEKAESELGEKMLFFSYAGETSMSSDLSNELSHKYPGVFVIVAFNKEGITNVSMRGSKIRDVFEKILPKLENAKGGGHLDAVGARIQSKDVDKLKELFLEEMK